MAGLHPDDRALTQAAVDKALDPSGDGRYCAEFRVISREDGIERWIAATGQTYCADSRPVRLVGTVQDITRRKQGEVELVRTGTLLETLLASAPLGFCYFDRELRYVRINDRLAAMNGIPAAEHIGRTVAEIVPSLAPIVQEVTGRILTTGQAVVGYEFFGETPLNPGVTRY